MDYKKQIISLTENDFIEIFKSEIKKIGIDFYFLEHSEHFLIKLFFEKLLNIPKNYRLKNNAKGVYKKHIDVAEIFPNSSASYNQSTDVKELLYDKPLCNLKTFFLKASPSSKKFFLGSGMYSKLLYNNRGESFCYSEDLFIENFKFLTQKDKVIFAKDLKEYFLSTNKYNMD